MFCKVVFQIHKIHIILYNTYGHGHIQILRCFMIQLTLEDSGSPQATNLDYNVNDETCEVIVFNDSIHVKGGVSQNIFTRSLLRKNLSSCLSAITSRIRVTWHSAFGVAPMEKIWSTMYSPYGENMITAVCPRSQNAKFQGPYGHPTDIPSQRKLPRLLLLGASLLLPLRSSSSCQ